MDSPKSVILSPEYSLKHVLFFFRHGDRTPICSYEISPKLSPDASTWESKVLPREAAKTMHDCIPVLHEDGREIDINDPCLSKGKWPFGQLTTKGSEDMVAVGRKVREKYASFIHSFNGLEHEHIYLRSTLSRRTIQSLQFLLKGMFPEWFDSEVNEVEKFIHVCTPNRMVVRLNRKLYKQECDLARVEKLAPIDIDNLEARIRNILDYDPEKYISWEVLREVMVCYQSHGVDLPEGITAEVIDEIIRYNAFEWHSIYSKKQVIKPAFDNCIREISAILNDVAHDRVAQKFSFLSTHDSSIMALLTVLGTNIGKIPEYGSILTIEMYQKEHTKEHYVKIFFDDKELTIFGHSHGSMCPIEHFHKLVSRVVEGVVSNE